MAQNSLWATGCRERLPALHELLELRVRLLGRTRVEPEPSAMDEHALLLLQEFVVVHLRDGLDRFGQRAGAGDEFPGAFTQHEAFGRADLTGGGQQPSGQIAELAFAIIVGARQTGHVIGVKQTRCVAVPRP